MNTPTVHTNRGFLPAVSSATRHTGRNRRRTEFLLQPSAVFFNVSFTPIKHIRPGVCPDL